ncbi:MAG: c-type cytochrome [Saprospiraceae bacterium]
MSKIKIGLATLVCIQVLIACQEELPTKPLQVQVGTTDFEEAQQVNPALADGLTMELWAPGPLLSNAVALTFDHQGIAYVSETIRRKSSKIDIRLHPDWMTEDLALASLDDIYNFHLKKLATKLSSQNTWQEDFNQDGLHDYRDLEVQSERIRRIWDSDGDGRADVSQLYAEGFDELLTGVAAGILSYDDDIFLSVAPALWKLSDQNGDGIADERESLSRGFGIHIGYAGHDMSGVTMGMDGKIYWSIGDLGVNAEGPDGRSWVYPHQGAVMRCNPDGSDFEVFAHGLRNPQELAFDNYGNLISVDNDGDHAGEHERYVHIIEGSDSGWRTYWQYGKYNDPRERYKVWTDELLHVPHFPGQAAYLLPPIALAYSGPAGLAFNPGTALGGTWKEHFFASYFTGSSANSKVQAFQLKPKGASFEVSSIQDVVGGIVPTGLTFGPDGHLYINDWKDSYDKKPTGRIWKLKSTDNTNQALQQETQEILAIGMQQRSVSELANLLNHADQRVRLAAQFALVKRQEKEVLLTSTQSSTSLFGRLHAIWGLGQMGRQETNILEPLIPMLTDSEAAVRAQVAKVLGEGQLASASEALIKLLQDPSPMVQYAAVNALGKLKINNAYPALIDLLTKVKDQDPHLRHGIIYALSKIGTPIQLADLAEHPSIHVRLGAVVALREQKAPAVQAFLADQEGLVLAEAARAINDDQGIPEAVPALAEAITRTDVDNEAFLRRAINANLRQADAASAQRLASFIKTPEVAPNLKQDAIWALGYWAKPPVLDRVDGRYRELMGHQLADAQAAIASIFPSILQSGSPVLQIAILQTAGHLKYQQDNSLVEQLFQNRNAPTKLRVAALQCLAALQAPQLPQALDLALEAPQLTIRLEAQNILTKSDLSTETKIELLNKVLQNNSVSEQQQALGSLAKMDQPKSQAIIEEIWENYQMGQLDSTLHLDLLMAIDSSGFNPLKQKKQAFKKSVSDSNPLISYSAVLYGGNVERGEQIFKKSEAAQCLRCHASNSADSQVGPTLKGISKILSRQEILLALVAPNDRIAPGYGTSILSLKDGKEVAGILLEETTENIRLKVRKDSLLNILKTDIQAREDLPSGMFNMGEILNQKQIRDLVEYLSNY